MKIKGTGTYLNYDFINFEGKVLQEGEEKKVRIQTHYVAKPDTTKIESATIVDTGYQRVDLSFRNPVRPKFAVLHTLTDSLNPMKREKSKKQNFYQFESSSQKKKRVNMSTIEHHKNEIVLIDLPNPVFDWINISEILKLKPGQKAHTIVNQVSLQKGSLLHKMQKYVADENFIRIEKDGVSTTIKFFETDEGTSVHVEDGSPITYNFLVS